MNLRGRNKVSAEFSMSSMTDIVFLLLVFFLLTSPAITPDALDLILPKAKGKTTHKQNVSVSITNDGAFYVNKERVSEYSIEKRSKRSSARGENRRWPGAQPGKGRILPKAGPANDQRWRRDRAVGCNAAEGV